MAKLLLDRLHLSCELGFPLLRRLLKLGQLLLRFLPRGSELSLEFFRLLLGLCFTKVGFLFPALYGLAAGSPVLPEPQ